MRSSDWSSDVCSSDLDGPGDGGDGEDVTGALCAHAGKRGTGDVHGSERVGLELLLDQVERGLLEQSELPETSVVDEHVDSPELLDRLLDCVGGLRFVGHVELHSQEVVGRAEGVGDGFGAARDRKSGVEGKSVSVRLDLGGSSTIKTKKQKKKKKN